MEHYFYLCSAYKELWKAVLFDIREITGPNFQLSNEIVMMGYAENTNVTVTIAGLRLERNCSDRIGGMALTRLSSTSDPHILWVV